MSDWQDRGLCRGREPDIWFEPASTELAKSICRRCPVRIDCLAYAVVNDERRGVWGGRTPGERAATRAKVHRLTPREAS